MKFKKVLSILAIVLMLAMTFVSASEKITTIPSGFNSFEEWKQSILEANGGRGYFSTTSSYWGLCERQCSLLPFNGDCSPCSSGETASMCTYNPDSMSSMTTWASATAYCNDFLKPYNYYNRQCYCQVPTTQCSGGADAGDRKCTGDSVYQCSSSGVWEIVTNCPNGCEGGTCQQQQCTDHSTKKCDGTSVYWYNSCGEKQEEYERCDSNEVCENSQCVKVCEEGYIGSKLCSGKNIVQQYQNADCTTEIKTLETCSDSCQNSQCTSPQCPTCSAPTSWSQCNNGQMFRTNYKCDATTNYQCQSFTDTTSCECGTSPQCSYDEVCESNVCVTLDCAENEVADNHECIEKSSSMGLIIGIIVGVFVILIIVVVFLVIKVKGGRNKKR